MDCWALSPLQPGDTTQIDRCVREDKSEIRQPELGVALAHKLCNTHSND